MNETTTPTIYGQTGEYFRRISAGMKEGEEANLSPVALPHFAIYDTGLAACLATLGMPLREPAPFTDDVQLDERGDEVGRRLAWWLGDHSLTRSIDNGKGAMLAESTEAICDFWTFRDRFEREQPLHPLVAMRTALDARSFWLDAVFGRSVAFHRPHSEAAPVYGTDSLHGAALLKACGFRPIGITGAAAHGQARAFLLEAGISSDATGAGKWQCEQVLQEAALPEGQRPQQWMARVLRNYSEMVKHAKRSSTIIQQPRDGRILMLTADATPKTKAKFEALL